MVDDTPGRVTTSSGAPVANGVAGGGAASPVPVAHSNGRTVRPHRPDEESYLSRFKRFMFFLVSSFCYYMTCGCICQRSTTRVQPQNLIRPDEAGRESVSGSDAAGHDSVSGADEAESEDVPSAAQRLEMAVSTPPSYQHPRTSQEYRRFPGRLGIKNNDCCIQSLLYFYALDPDHYEMVCSLYALNPNDEIISGLRNLIFAMTNNDAEASAHYYDVLYDAMARYGLIQPGVQQDTQELSQNLHHHIDDMVRAQGIDGENSSFYRRLHAGFYRKVIRTDMSGFEPVSSEGTEVENPYMILRMGEQPSFHRWIQNYLVHWSGDERANIYIQSRLSVDRAAARDQLYLKFMVQPFSIAQRGNRLRIIKKTSLLKRVFAQLPVSLRLSFGAVLLDGEERVKVNYRLHLMVLHSGTRNRGHFIAAVRGSDGFWTVFDTNFNEPRQAGNDVDFANAYIQTLNFTPYLLSYIPSTTSSQSSSSQSISSD